MTPSAKGLARTALAAQERVPAEAGRAQPGRDLDAGRAPRADGQPRLAGVLQGLELRRRGRVRRCRLEGPATIPLRHAVRIQLADEDADSPGSGPGRLLQDLPEERAAMSAARSTTRSPGPGSARPDRR